METQSHFEENFVSLGAFTGRGMCKVLKFFLNPLQLQSILPSALLMDAENTNIHMKSRFSMLLTQGCSWGHSSYLFPSKHKQDMMPTQGKESVPAGGKCDTPGAELLLIQGFNSVFAKRKCTLSARGSSKYLLSRKQQDKRQWPQVTPGEV